MTAATQARYLQPPTPAGAHPLALCLRGRLPTSNFRQHVEDTHLAWEQGGEPPLTYNGEEHARPRERGLRAHQLPKPRSHHTLGGFTPTAPPTPHGGAGALLGIRTTAQTGPSRRRSPSNTALCGLSIHPRQGLEPTLQGAPFSAQNTLVDFSVFSC